MPNVRLSPVSSLDVKSFSAGLISTKETFIQNGVIHKHPDGEPYVTQRPTFSTETEPGDAAVTDFRGRGIFFSTNINTTYFVNNDTVYSNTYATPLPVAAGNAGLSPGTTRVYFTVLNGVVYIIDPANNAGYFINSSEEIEDMDASGTGTFTNFPPNNSRTLAHGAVTLDRTMYVLTDSGEVWGSDLNDGSLWTNGLNFIRTEKEEDTAKFITKHHDNIVVFGSRTTEFLYNAANATGSSLAVRQDISYNVGCADPDSVWRNGDDIYFLGVDSAGEIAAYILTNYQIHKISETSLTSFFTHSLSKEDLLVIGSGMSAGNVTFYVLTTYHLSTDATPVVMSDESVVYNTDTKTWTNWAHGSSAITAFPLVSWTITDNLRAGTGILASGEVLELSDNYNPQDSKVSGEYIETNYIASGYYNTVDGGTPDIVSMMVRLTDWDGGTRNWKYIHSLRFVGDETSSPQDLQVSWSEHDINAFNTPRALDISDARNKLVRLGRSKNRYFQIDYSGTEQIRFEGLDLYVTEGTH